MGHYSVKTLGGFILWMFKGFKGKFTSYQTHKYAFEIGFGLIIIVILIIKWLF